MTLVGEGRTPELDTLLSVEQAAERLGTSVRFVRRLVFQRRIAYVKLGRHVRIAARAREHRRIAREELTTTTRSAA